MRWSYFRRVEIRLIVSALNAAVLMLLWLRLSWKARFIRDIIKRVSLPAPPA